MKIVKKIFEPKDQGQEVEGKPKKENDIDLSNADIEDADYKDL